MTRTQKLTALGAAGALTTGLLLAQGFAGFGRQRMEARFDKLATYLNLSSDQKSQAKTIIEGAFGQAQPLFAELRQNHQAMQQLVKSGPSGQFDQQAQKLANDQGAVLSRLILLHARTMAQVRALLTPDQIQKAEQLRELMKPWWHGRAGAPGPF